MICKLCGEHLYKNITFENIFKFHYYLHRKCEEKLNENEIYYTFPMLNKLVFRDYLFEERNSESDIDFLFQKYSHLLYERMTKNKSWSIVVFTEEKLLKDDLILITELSDYALLFCSVFNENII